MISIRTLATSGLKWSSISQVTRIGTQLLGMVVLARILPTSDYGLIAMAVTVTGFASLFRDFGTAAAIIQKQEPSPQLLDSVFWLNVGFGFSLAVLLGVLTPLIALGFAEPRLKEVLWVLLLTFPIASMGTVHQVLLEKASNFRPLAIIESGAAVVGLAGAVWAAQSGWGVYSLVLQTLLAAILTTVCLWIASKWRPVMRWDAAEIRGVLGFGGNLVGFNVVNYFIRNADNLLVARFLGASDLGYYSMAYRLMLWPLQNIANVVGRALFPVFSRLQIDHGNLADTYTRASASIVLITAPLMLGFFVLREPFVEVVLGERWMPLVDILAWLVPVGLLQSIGTTVGTLYMATGRTDVMFKWGIGAGLLVIPSFWIGLQWGVVGVAASYAVASMLLFYPGLAIPFKFVGLKVRYLLLRIIPSLATAIVMALVVAGLAAIWPSNVENQLLRLLMLISVGVVTYVAISLFTQRALLKDISRALLNR